MSDRRITPLVALAATRPEAPWPEELDLDRFRALLLETAPSAVDVRDISDARSLRDTVAALLLDGSDAGAFALANETMAQHGVTPVVDGSGIRYRSSRTDTVSAVWAEIAGPLLAALAAGVRGRVRRCASDPCVTPFIDTAQGGREYCCARCATRARVRRHRAEKTTAR
ncbi:CGNR zinc finger domain-containing protein [Microbacterium chocolatum]|uniref:CGNR zinc finger domain-containing protein n=1 Tax=Microbacterium aurantiacum TaxID=162393 RepID=UPI00338D9EBE